MANKKNSCITNTFQTKTKGLICEASKSTSKMGFHIQTLVLTISAIRMTTFYDRIENNAAFTVTTLVIYCPGIIKVNDLVYKFSN
jgi:deoxyribodipyrimidine photolyase-like uncharacterized protein